MGLSVGEIQATLTLKDQMSAQMQQAAASSGQSLGQVKAALILAQKAMNDVEDAIKTMGSQSAKVTQALVPEYDAATKKVIDLQSQVKTLTDEYKNQGKAAQDLGTAVKQNVPPPEAEANVRKLSQSLVDLGRGLREAGTLLTAGLTVPIVAVGVETVKFGAAFQTEMTRVVTLGGASVKEVQSLRQAVLDLAPATAIGPAELAKGLLVVESAGFRGAVATDTLATAAKMSALGLGETAETARAVVGAMLSYRNQNLSAAEAADVLTKTVQLGNMKISELVPAMARVNQIAAAMGVSFQDVAAGIATFTHMGADASVAATGMRAILNGILNDAPKTEKGFRDLAAAVGDTSITMENFKKEMAEKGLTQAMVDLMDKVTSAGDAGVSAIAKIFPNIRALTEALAVYRTNGGMVVDILEKIKDSHGTLEKSTAELQKTWDFQWNAMKASMETLFISLSQDLMPVFHHFVEFVKGDVVPVLHELISAFHELPDWAKTTFVALAVGAAGLGPALLILGQFAMAIGNITKAMSLLAGGEAVAGMSGVVLFLANPYVLAGAGILAAIAVAGYQVHKMLQDVAHVDKAGQPLKDLVAANPQLAYTVDNVKNLSIETGNLKDGTTLLIPAFANAATAGTQAHLSLLQQVKALTAEQRAAIDADKARGLSIKEIAADTGIASDVIGVYERQLASQAKAMKAAQKEIESFQRANDNMMAAIGDQAWDGSVEGAIRLGAHVKDIATWFGMNTVEVQKWQQALKDTDKYNDALTNIEDTLHGQGIEWDWTAEQALKFGASQTDVATVLNMTKGEIKATTQELKFYAEQAKWAKEAIKNWMDAEKDDQGIASKNWQDYTDRVNKMMLNRWDYERLKLEEWQNDQEGAINYSVPGWEAAYAAIAAAAKARFAEIGQAEQAATVPLKATSDWSAALSMISDQFVKLGQVAGASLAPVLQSIGQMVVMLEAANKATSAKDANGDTIGGNWGQMSVVMSDTTTRAQKTAAGIAAAAAVAQGAMNVWEATGSHATRAGNAMGGLMAGAQAGAAFGPYGIAIGAAAGLIVGLIRGKPEWAKAADDVGRDFGAKISDALAKEIADLEKSEHTSRLGAELLDMNKIIGEAGGLTAKNLSQMTQRLHDVFSMIETHQLTLEQGTKVLDQNWQAFADAGTDADGRLSDSLKEIIALNERFGTQSKAIADYLKQQGSNAIDAFNVVVAGTADAVVGWDNVKKAIDDANTSWDAAKKNGDRAGMDKADKAYIEAVKAQKLAAGEAKQELADLGVQAIASFTAAVAAGMSMAEAMDKMGPSFDTLNKAYEDLGLSIDDVALKSLLMQRKIQQGSPPLMAAVGGLTKEMIALDNMGLLNVNTFQSMERTGMQMYVRLQAQAAAAGGTTKDALVPMQAWLHAAAMEAERLGIPLDENTQMLIDQSKELGIWKDQGKSATDILTDSMTKLVDKVALLIDTLNGVTDATNRIPRNVDQTINQHVVKDGPETGDQGVPTFGPEVFVPHPMLAKVGTDGGEYVLHKDTVDKLARGGGKANEVHFHEYFTFDFSGVKVLDGTDLDHLTEKELMPRILQNIEDRRRDYVPRMKRVLLDGSAG